MLSEFLDSEVLHNSVTLAAFAFYFVGSVYSTEI